jgi:hypothetical protein
MRETNHERTGTACEHTPSGDAAPGGILGTLAHEDWQRSSRCDQWTVADVVAHLTALTQAHTALIVRALRGDTSPPQECR